MASASAAARSRGSKDSATPFSAKLAMTLLCLHAYRLRAVRELSELEKFDTRYQIFRLATLVAVGLIAALLARIPFLRNWSSMVYRLLFPILRTSRVIHRRRRAPYLAATADGNAR